VNSAVIHNNLIVKNPTTPQTRRHTILQFIVDRNTRFRLLLVLWH